MKISRTNRYTNPPHDPDSTIGKIGTAKVDIIFELAKKIRISFVKTCKKRYRSSQEYSSDST